MERCELSDLPVSQCACRKHKPGQEVDAHEVASTFTRDGGPGPIVVARYPGTCVTCAYRYQVGEEIRPVMTMGGTRWGHAACFD